MGRLRWAMTGRGESWRPMANSDRAGIVPNGAETCTAPPSVVSFLVPATSQSSHSLEAGLGKSIEPGCGCGSIPPSIERE